MSENRIALLSVAASDRLNFLPHHFGPAMTAFEGSVYSFARLLSGDYSGGYWEYCNLSNGGCFMYPPPADDKLYRVVSPNGWVGNMDEVDFGITACLFALSNLCFQFNTQKHVHIRDQIAARFHLLRAYASQRERSEAIFAAID